MSEERKRRITPQLRAAVSETIRKKWLEPEYRDSMVSTARERHGKPFFDQFGTRYGSRSDAAQKIGCTAQSVGDVLKGRSESAHGYVFYYEGQKPPPLAEAYRGRLYVPVSVRRKKILDEHGREFASMTEAAAFFGCSIATVSRTISSGRRSRFCGYLKEV